MIFSILLLYRGSAIIIGGPTRFLSSYIIRGCIKVFFTELSNVSLNFTVYCCYGLIMTELANDDVIKISSFTFTFLTRISLVPLFLIL